MREQSDAAFEIQDSELQRLVTGAQEGFETMQTGLESTKEGINKAMGEVAETVSN